LFLCSLFSVLLFSALLLFIPLLPIRRLGLFPKMVASEQLAGVPVEEVHEVRPEKRWRGKSCLFDLMIVSENLS
jgi:hypothetical protein